ncbi:hypothetical protein [Loktanella sp. M215]|uniref:hypothetical protein n=1 Tax=Loktanella sp. M215 TaxID=2675431 RepID=UPI001F3BB5DA|nr:hypothetical protein [Loktanella sp. M215]MCF7701755.1 hypothetical protein [Loktanella sp. M215]
MNRSWFAIVGTLTLLQAGSAFAQQGNKTGAGNPSLNCTQFLDLEATAQQNAVANLMTVGSNEMPPADAGVDSGDVGNLTSSDVAGRPNDAAMVKDNSNTGADNAGVDAEVSPDMVRAMVNICNNSVEPS